MVVTIADVPQVAPPTPAEAVSAPVPEPSPEPALSPPEPPVAKSTELRESPRLRASACAAWLPSTQLSSAKGVVVGAGGAGGTRSGSGGGVGATSTEAARPGAGSPVGFSIVRAYWTAFPAGEAAPASSSSLTSSSCFLRTAL